MSATNVEHSLSDTFNRMFVKKLEEAFPAERWYGDWVSLPSWRRYDFAWLSNDWNRIHFKPLVSVDGSMCTVVHGAMLSVMLPLFAGRYIERLKQMVHDEGRHLIDVSSSCKFSGFCPVGAIIQAQILRKGIRNSEEGVFITLEYTLVAKYTRGSVKHEKIVQRGTRMLAITPQQ